jgi:hypothetical protein
MQDPASTWLREDVVRTVDETTPFDENGLRGVVTMMIFARDELAAEIEEEEIERVELLLDGLRTIHRSVEELRSIAELAASKTIADALCELVYGVNEADNIPPLILRLDESERSLDSVAARVSEDSNFAEYKFENKLKQT